MLSNGSAKEGQNIFGSGSMAGIAISLLIKNPKNRRYGKIFYYDIGDELSQQDKLAKVANCSSMAGITDWQVITPDTHGDWLKQRDDSFDAFIVIGDKKTAQPKLFGSYSLGVSTNRDAWVSI